MSMFCNQCQEAAKGVGCTIVGVCGKSPELSALMDTYMYALSGLSKVVLKANEYGLNTDQYDLFVIEGLFKTITNANFNEEVFEEECREAFRLREDLKDLVKEQGYTFEEQDLINFKANDRETLMKKAFEVGVLSTEDEDIRALRGLIRYGLKGLAAYLSHA
jgi:hydroxylamine reductase